jgi:RimJ/RimL family protein N-acetyltransferase
MLFGKSVRLRTIDRDDIPTFVRWFNDPDVRHFLQMFEPMSRAGEERWFEEHLKKQSEFLFAIEAPVEDGWLTIGNVGLHRVDWKNSGVTLGIVVGEKAFWGKGFGSDAVQTMLRFAFEELNLHRVELEVYDFNPRARRCYEKAGFRLEGTRRQAHFHQGAYHDVQFMGILRDEFHPD